MRNIKQQFINVIKNSVRHIPHFLTSDTQLTKEDHVSRTREIRLYTSVCIMHMSCRRIVANARL